MELGGNAPFIVFDDADIDSAVNGAVLSKYRNAGQTCVCANRFYVQDAVYDEFVGKFTVAVQELRVGRGEDAGVSIGPLISESAVEKVEELLADSLEKGAVVVEGGHRHALGGHFYEPTIVKGATGPLWSLHAKRSSDRLRRYSASRMKRKLSSWPMRRNSGWPHTFMPAISAVSGGSLKGLNTGWFVSMTEFCRLRSHPFGGVKESGSGREGSKYGIDEFIEIKAITMAGL